jgi:hypothetical protein
VYRVSYQASLQCFDRALYRFSYQVMYRDSYLFMYQLSHRFLYEVMYRNLCQFIYQRSYPFMYQALYEHSYGALYPCRFLRTVVASSLDYRTIFLYLDPQWVLLLQPSWPTSSNGSPATARSSRLQTTKKSNSAPGYSAF